MKIGKIVEENGKKFRGKWEKKFKEKQNHELVNNIVLLGAPQVFKPMSQPTQLHSELVCAFKCEICKHKHYSETPSMGKKRYTENDTFITFNTQKQAFPKRTHNFFLYPVILHGLFPWNVLKSCTTHQPCVPSKRL